MNSISDGTYQVNIVEDGETIPQGCFIIAGNTISYPDQRSEMALGDLLPAGQLSGPIRERIERFLDHHHGYVYIERIK